MSRKKTQKSTRLKIHFFIVAAGILLFLSLDMYQKFKIDLINKDLHRLEQQKKQIQSETEILRSQVEQLRNIDRITDIARKEYNMINNTDPVSAVKIDDIREVEDLKSKFAQRNAGQKKIKMAGIN